MQNVSKIQAAAAFIQGNAKQTLIIDFIKKTNGEKRRMVCYWIQNETLHKFNPMAKGLLQVWDMEKGARRYVNLEGVLSIKVQKSGEVKDFTTLEVPKPKKMSAVELLMNSGNLSYIREAAKAA
jgi:hypothetical protein